MVQLEVWPRDRSRQIAREHFATFSLPNVVCSWKLLEIVESPNKGISK